MRRLHHVALGATDVERVAEFYQGIFGLQECARHLYDDGRLRSIWLNMSGAVLMVEHTRQAPRRVHGVGRGPFLIAFSAEDPAERRAVEERAAAAGSPTESRTEFTSYFRDPEGNRVAVSCY
jgi:catechol 2,3-dioxygenase-like lactoylglutathione lyase family enzyme